MRLDLAKALILLGIAVGVARIGPSDRWLVTGLVAYVPAAGALAASAVALAFFATAGRLPRGWGALGLLVAAVSALAIARDNRHLLDPPAPVPPGPHLRILHWNIARSRGLAGLIAGLEPDVVCLSEPRGVSRRAMGEGWAAWRKVNLLILSRHPIERRQVWHGAGMKGLHVVIGSDPPLSLLFVDMVSDPLVSRRAALESLAAALPAMTPAPDVVVGDLNTPAGAFSLRAALERDYADGYREAGSGPGYTWPSYLPVMKIDHALARRGVRIVRYTSGFSWRSDHRWQMMVVAPPRAAPPPH